MKSPFLRGLVLLAVVAVFPAQADFNYGSEPLFLNKGVQPNVALLLDNSGSMSATDTGGTGNITSVCNGATLAQPLARMQAAKEAACQMVQGNASNMRISLFAFTGGLVTDTSSTGIQLQPFGSNATTLRTSIQALSADQSTPLGGAMLVMANTYMGPNSPLQYRCQKNYAVLLTDGEPSSGIDYASSAFTLPVLSPAQSSPWPNSTASTGTVVGSPNWDGYPDPLYVGGSGRSVYPWLDDLTQLVYDVDIKDSTSFALSPALCGGASSAIGKDCSGNSWDVPGFSKQNVATYTIGFGAEANNALLRSAPLVNQISIVPADVDVVSDTITIENHGLVTGDFVHYYATAQPAIGGLYGYVTDAPTDSSPNPVTENSARGKYFVENWDSNTIRLYECGNVNCTAPDFIPVDLTSTGDGVLSVGPGKSRFASTTTELTAAMNNVFNHIKLDNARVDIGMLGSSMVANSSELTANSRIYQARFNPADWSGDLVSLEIVNGVVESEDTEWRASDDIRLPAYSSRNIKTRNDTAGAINFSTTAWVSLTTAQRTALNSGGSVTVGQNVLNWVRGQDVTGYRFRTNGKLGDMLNSGVVYVGQSRENYVAQLPAVAGTGQDSYNTFKMFTVGREPMVYVGSNDGMLHGFSASTNWATQGVEVFAFIPEAVYMDWHDQDNDGVKDTAEPAINKFYELSQNFYGQTSVQPHRYFVDGTPVVGDAFFGAAKAGLPANSWHTVLVGGLGKGGRSVYALDVTDPATSFTTANVLWEFDDSNSGDMGYSYSRPVIARMGTSGGGGGQWVAIFGNGYDSRADQARLYIVNIETGALIQEITLGTAGSNGLSSVSVLTDVNDFDADSDKVEVLTVYAGDLQGNVWKVNINGGDNVAFTMPTSLVTPFFIAQDAGGVRQAITSEITLNRYPALDGLDGINREAGVMLFFGTGSYFHEEDRSYNYPVSGPQYDAMYGIWDKGDVATVAMSDLVEQQMGTTVINGETYRTATGNDVNYEGIPPPVERGWYIKLAVTLPANDFKGERVVFSPSSYGVYVVFNTVIPASADPCEGGGSSWQYVVNAMTGGANAYSPFDLDDDGDNLDEDASVIGIDFAEVLLSKPLVLDDAGDTLPGDSRVCLGKSNGTVECKEQYDPPPPPDSDGDGYLDEIDVFPSDPNEWMDTDHDGVGDNADAFPDDPAESVDTDNDTIGNNADWDDDNDDVLDGIDAAPLDAGDTTEIILPLDATYKGSALTADQISQ